jgi:hypothetical protein
VLCNNCSFESELQRFTIALNRIGVVVMSSAALQVQRERERERNLYRGTL